MNEYGAGEHRTFWEKARKRAAWARGWALPLVVAVGGGLAMVGAFGVAVPLDGAARDRLRDLRAAGFEVTTADAEEAAAANHRRGRTR